LINDHNPGSRTPRSLQVRKASEGTLNLVWGISSLLEIHEDEESEITETSESNKAPNQMIRWNPGRRQTKTT
jgi:hypothetical protein